VRQSERPLGVHEGEVIVENKEPKACFTFNKGDGYYIQIN